MEKLEKNNLMKIFVKLYVEKYFEWRSTSAKLNKCCAAAFKNRLLSAKIVRLNTKLTETLLLLEKMTYIFESLGINNLDCA